MNDTTISATAAHAVAWAKRRATEPSTWIGLGMAAASTKGRPVPVSAEADAPASA